jgi:hypothetical protein
MARGVIGAPSTMSRRQALTDRHSNSSHHWDTGTGGLARARKPTVLRLGEGLGHGEEVILPWANDQPQRVIRRPKLMPVVSVKDNLFN